MSSWSSKIFFKNIFFIVTKNIGRIQRIQEGKKEGRKVSRPPELNTLKQAYLTWERGLVPIVSAYDTHCNGLFFWLVFYFILFFLRATPVAYGSSQARGELELQLIAYSTATATWDPSHVGDLHHSSRQRWIPDPLSKAGDRTCILIDTSRIRFRCATMGPPHCNSLCLLDFRTRTTHENGFPIVLWIWWILLYTQLWIGTCYFF